MSDEYARRSDAELDDLAIWLEEERIALRARIKALNVERARRAEARLTLLTAEEQARLLALARSITPDGIASDEGFGSF